MGSSSLSFPPSTFFFLSSSLIFNLSTLLELSEDLWKDTSALASPQVNGVRVIGRGKTPDGAYMPLPRGVLPQLERMSLSPLNLWKHLLSFLPLTHDPIPFFSSGPWIPSLIDKLFFTLLMSLLVKHRFLINIYFGEKYRESLFLGVGWEANIRLSV